MKKCARWYQHGKKDKPIRGSVKGKNKYSVGNNSATTNTQEAHTYDYNHGRDCEVWWCISPVSNFCGSSQRSK
jgi:hypothetical protein